MKKGWKIAGATIAGLTALAALLPYSFNKEKGQTTVYALLWKYTIKETDGWSKPSLRFGFHNPMKDWDVLPVKKETFLCEECGAESENL